MAARIEDNAQLKEDIVFCIIVSLLRDRGGRRYSVSLHKLHLCWQHLVDHMTIAGVSTKWHQDPVTGIWEELEKTTRKLVSDRMIIRGDPSDKSSISLSMNLVDETKFLRRAWKAYIVILNIFPDFAKLYDQTEVPAELNALELERRAPQSAL